MAPLGVGPLIEVDTVQPVDVRALTRTVRRALEYAAESCLMTTRVPVVCVEYGVVFTPPSRSDRTTGISQE